MYKVETKDKGDFSGFGGNGGAGEYFYSQNMKESLNGMVARWRSSKKIAVLIRRSWRTWGF